jgi:hypothetical protein
MIATLVWLLLASTLSVPASRQDTARHDDPDPFLLGVLRRDGIVSPFASYDGKRWEAPWPGGNLHSLEIPITLESVPRRWWGKTGPVDGMTAWVDGASRGPLKLTKPTVAQVMCGAQIGLASDYKSSQPVPPPVVQPFPKDGLAVTGNQRLEPIETVTSASPEWAPATAAMRDQFDRAEDAAVQAFIDWKHPFGRNERRKLPIELETMYRAPMDDPGWMAYYVEAIRRYPPGPGDEDCGLITSASGWIVAPPGGKRTAWLRARVTYCDRRGVAYMLPLGLFKLRGRTYWAYQLSGFGQESYAIAHPQRKVIMQEVFYSSAGCPL